LGALIKYIIPIFFSIGTGAVATGTGNDAAIKAMDSSMISTRLAVLPFVNYSGHAEAIAVFDPFIKDYIARSEFALVAPDAIKRELRQYRIRSTATIGLEDAARISRDLEVDYFMLGSIDIFMPGEVPEAAISVRVIDAANMTILWASSAAASGLDYVKILDVGKITSIEQLARRLTEELFADFNIQLIQNLAQDSTHQTGPLHTLVVFDNLSPNKSAGNIITMIAISDLTAHKIHVLEPGVAIELFRQNGQSLMGSIELDLLKQLYDKYNIERVITGTVDLFQSNPADAEGATVEVELGGRYLDAATGKILAAAETNRRGTDSETIFKLGITHSLGRLAKNTIHSLLEKLHVYEN
jgi:TolB-like protein